MAARSALMKSYVVRKWTWPKVACPTFLEGACVGHGKSARACTTSAIDDFLSQFDGIIVGSAQGF